MEEIKRCLQCEIGEVYLREGKYGEFYSCSDFPICDWTMNFYEGEDFEQTFYKKYGHKYGNETNI